MTPAELANKIDSEGGIYAAIQYGGPELFECLGPEAVELARTAEAALEDLRELVPDLIPEEDQ